MTLEEVKGIKLAIYENCSENFPELRGLVDKITSHLKDPNLTGENAIDFMNNADEILSVRAEEIGLAHVVNPLYFAIMKNEISNLRATAQKLNLSSKPILFQKPELFNNLQSKIRASNKIIKEGSPETFKIMESWKGLTWESAITKSKFINN